MMRRYGGCPVCGSNQWVRVRKRGIQRIKSPNGWGVRRGTPRKSMRVYWDEFVVRRDGTFAKCPHPCHNPRPRRVLYGQKAWPPFSADNIDPATLPVVALRPPKDRKDEFVERAKAKRKRHRDRQSKLRR